MSGRPQKPWSSLTARRQREAAKDLAQSISPFIDSEQDLRNLFKTVTAWLQKEHPNLQLQDTQCWELIRCLADLRKSDCDSNVPTISVQDLDGAIARLDVDPKELAAHGYTLCRTPTELAASRAKPKVKRGRRPKLHNETFQKIVYNAISPHIIDSEQVAVLGRGAKRRMVLAKHLTKTKHRIFQEDNALQKAMSWSNFHRIMAIYFPYIKNPRRQTDICSLDPGSSVRESFLFVFIHLGATNA